MTDKKPGFFKRLFSRKPRDVDAEKEKVNRPSAAAAPPTSTDTVSGGKAKEKRGAAGGHGHTKAAIPSVTVDPPPDDKKSPAKKPVPAAAAAKQKKPRQETGSRSTAEEGTKQRRLSRKKRKDGPKGSAVVAPADPNQRLEFPTTPEMILAVHKRKPFLDKNEEWLVVELNEYECLVENLDIVKTIATHSQFFEVEPDELWEEFFEYVEEVPSYDEVINYDVWQEFRDEKYPC